MAKGKAPRPKRPVVSPEDQAMFLAAIGGTTPLSGDKRDRLPVPPPPPAPVKIDVLPAVHALAIEGDGQRYAARAAGVSHAQLSELRSGKVRIEQTLDLHGETIERGVARLAEFLLQSTRTGHRCVRVIHGKGLHSEHGAPLREAVLSE